MSDRAVWRTFARFRSAAFAGLAATVAGLGTPAIFAAETTFCDREPLKAQTPERDAQLGWAMAADGEWLAAGANLDDAKGLDSGSVTLFRNPRPGANPFPEIAPSDLQAGDQFGAAVSISNEWLAVGAPVGDGRVRDSGVVYLFQLVGSSWEPRGKLEAADAVRGDRFGTSVSLSGRTLIVGAPHNSDRGSQAGSAYMFQRSAAGVWSETAQLRANDARPFDTFGASVAITQDENTVVIGAPFADDLSVLRNFGAAYVFRRDSAAAQGWSQRARDKLTASETFKGNNIQFGSSVAIRGDRIVVGAPGEDAGNLTDSGAAHVFDWNGADWVRHPQPLVAEDPGRGEQLGTAVLIDGERLVIGAPFDNEGGFKAGAAYLFEKQGGSWKQTVKLSRHDTDSAFGQSVAVLDGQVFLGGFLDDVIPAAGGGEVMNAGSVAVCNTGPVEPPSVTCTKTGPAFVEAGDTVTYTIVVTNNESTAVAGVTLRDPTPARLTFVRADAPCENGFPCSLPDPIEPGQPLSIKVTFRVPDGCSAPRSITNKATLEVAGKEIANCMAGPTSVSGPPRVPDLECGKLQTRGPNPARPGDEIAYAIEASNIGCVAARDVTLFDPTPPGLEYVSGPCVLSPCGLGTIAPDGSSPPAIVTFRVLDECREEIRNVVTVDGSNADEDTCSFGTSLLADLAVDVTAPPSVPGGDEFDVSIGVSNAGPPTARDVELDLTIAEAGSITGIPAACEAVPGDPGRFTCDLDEIACGGEKELVFRVRAPACDDCAALGPITATATATAANADPATDSAVTAVVCSDLEIVKTDAPDPVGPGEALEYTLTVRNAGCVDVAAATVTDSFPPELTNVLWCRNAPCTPDRPGDLIDTLPLAAGDVVTYRVTGTVGLVCGGTILNTATVAGPPGFIDAKPENNSSTAETTIAGSGVKAFCLDIAGTFTEGGAITYIFLLLNCGPAVQLDNPGDELSDTLPATLTLTGAGASSGIATTSGNTAMWNGSIPVGGTVTITETATINAGTTGMTICNQATIAFDADGNGTNESAGVSDDPHTPAPDDPCCFVVPAVGVIPALSLPGLLALAFMLVILALLRLRRAQG